MAATNTSSSTYSTAPTSQVDWALSQQAQTFYETLQSEYDITILPIYGSLPEESSMKLRISPRPRTNNTEPTENSLSLSANPVQKPSSLVRWAHDKQTQDLNRYIRTQKSSKTLRVPILLRSNNTESTQNSSSSPAKPFQNTPSLVQWAHDRQNRDSHHAMRAQMSLLKLFKRGLD